MLIAGHSTSKTDIQSERNTSPKMATHQHLECRIDVELHEDFSRCYGPLLRLPFLPLVFVVGEGGPIRTALDVNKKQV